jgi:hypothetical protein
MIATDARSARWTDEEDAVLRRLAPTHSARQIGQVIGRSKLAVYGRAQRRGWRLPVKTGDLDQRTKHPDSLVEWTRRQREQGMPVSKIAQKAGVPYSIVKSWVYFEARRSASLSLVRHG